MTGPAALYSHTQRGLAAVTVVAMGLAFLAILVVPAMASGTLDLARLWIPLLIMGILLALILGIFTRLRVSIDERELRWAFGSGWPRFAQALDQVESATIVSNPVWYGYGIRLTPKGTLYNIAGKQAVEIVRRNGQRFRIGTDEPEALLAALESALAARPNHPTSDRT